VEYARTRAAARADERRFALQVTARAGLTDRLELRLEGEPLVALRGEDDATGLGDLAVALKYRVLDAAAVDADLASLKGPLPDYALKTGVSVRFGR
jgi:hypothetical protein